MSATVLKVEAETEACCVCGGGGELLTPEEHDAGAPPLHAPLRAMLLHLNHNKVVPEGRLCAGCARRAAEAYEFSGALSARAAPPLSDKIRALRRRLHELTQKIDVFIVVGGPGAGAGHAYSEDDIIMVEREALAAAAAADEDELEHARNARGDAVYQCSVCPLSFARAAECRAHAALHAPDATHSCWTCGAQFSTRDALRQHAHQHAAAHALTCHLCESRFQCQAEMRRHEAQCAARCPACGAECADRAALATHAAAQHGRDASPPHVCPACFRSFDAADLLTAHLLRHRQAKQFVCGYGDCVLRFGTRDNLMAHIRKCHAAELPASPPPPAAAAVPTPAGAVPCDSCDRTFGSAAAMKRHARVHRTAPPPPPPPAPAAPEPEAETDEFYVEETTLDGEEGEVEMETEVVQYMYSAEELEGEVEYLEVETLDEDEKPDLPAMH